MAEPSLPGNRVYALLLGWFRVAWLLCAAALAALVPALVFGSTAFGALVQLSLGACFAALAVAGLLALVTIARPQANGMPLPRTWGARVATLVAVLLAGLLDRG